MSDEANALPTLEVDAPAALALAEQLLDYGHTLGASPGELFGAAALLSFWMFRGPANPEQDFNLLSHYGDWIAAMSATGPVH